MESAIHTVISLVRSGLDPCMTEAVLVNVSENLP
jgi:hypothetical protein